MKKNKNYLLTLIAISIVVFVIGYFNMNYLIKVSTSQFLAIQIESSKREAKEFSTLVAQQIEYGIDRDVVIANVQKSIEGTNIESGFICMFDWSGVEICNPNPHKIGTQTNPSESYVRSLDTEIDAQDFYELLSNREQKGGVREFTGSRSSEIIYLYPVTNTDWIIAAHANIDKIEKGISKLRANFLLVYLLTSISIILLSIIIIRYLGDYYEKALELKNEKLTEEVINLSKLNLSLTNYKNKLGLSDVTQIQDDEIDEEGQNEHSESRIKRRLLSYSKDKLISIHVEDIAFISTENSITSIVGLDGKKYIHNSSLDEIYNSLDSSTFFRANRQYILSVKGIEEILRYGNSQLKIKVIADTDVIISKNKVAEFKKWLNY